MRWVMLLCLLLAGCGPDLHTRQVTGVVLERIHHDAWSDVNVGVTTGGNMAVTSSGQPEKWEIVVQADGYLPVALKTPLESWVKYPTGSKVPLWEWYDPKTGSVYKWTLRSE